MEQNLESYLKSMKIKTKSFGGYDPEDVILKMTEVAKLARSEGSGGQLEEYRAQAEAALNEEKQRCQEMEHALSTQEEKLRQTEEELAEKTKQLCQTEEELAEKTKLLCQTEEELAEKTKLLCQTEEEKQHLETELEELRSQRTAVQPEAAAHAAVCAEPAQEEPLFGQDSDAEKLRVLLASIELAKSDILAHYKEQAIKDANRIQAESFIIEQKNNQLQKMLEEDSHSLSLTLDTLLTQAQQMKNQLMSLCANENGTAE